MIASLAEATGLSKKETASFMDNLAAFVYKEAKKSGECIVPGFGKLVKAHRKAREGRNPATGAPMQIAASRKLGFSVAKAVKDKLNA